jgi:hypothetical protein
VRHEGVEDQRMRDPSEEFSVHLGSHPSGAAGQPAVPKPRVNGVVGTLPQFKPCLRARSGDSIHIWAKRPCGSVVEGSLYSGVQVKTKPPGIASVAAVT